MTAEMRKAPHPLDSADRALSDFYIFGYVKQIMTGESFSNAEELLSAIGAILDGIEKSTLIIVLLAVNEKVHPIC
jgi:hypothetical protein